MAWQCPETTCGRSFAREGYYIEHIRKHLNNGNYLTSLKGSSGTRKRQRPTPENPPPASSQRKAARREAKQLEIAREEWRKRQRERQRLKKRKKWYKSIASAKVGTASSSRAEVIDLRSPSRSPSIVPITFEDFDFGDEPPPYRKKPRNGLDEVERSFALSPDTTIPSRSRFTTPQMASITSLAIDILADSSSFEPGPSRRGGYSERNFPSPALAPSTLSQPSKTPSSDEHVPTQCREMNDIPNQGAGLVLFPDESAEPLPVHLTNHPMLSSPYSASISKIRSPSGSSSRLGPSWKTRTATPSIATLSEPAEEVDMDELDSDDESSVVSCASGKSDLFGDLQAARHIIGHIAIANTDVHDEVSDQSGSTSSTFVIAPTACGSPGSSQSVSSAITRDASGGEPGQYPLEIRYRVDDDDDDLNHVEYSSEKDDDGKDDDEKDDDEKDDDEKEEDEDLEADDEGEGETDNESEDEGTGYRILAGFSDLESVNSAQWGSNSPAHLGPFASLTPRRPTAREATTTMASHIQNEARALPSPSDQYPHQSSASSSSSMSRVSAELGSPLSIQSSASFPSTCGITTKDLAASMAIILAHLRQPLLPVTLCSGLCDGKLRAELLALLEQGRMDEAIAMLKDQKADHAGV